MLPVEYGDGVCSLKLVGIDGCRGGWVVATADGSLESVAFAVVKELDGIFHEVAAGGMVVAIDNPIGLPEAGDRACDRAARRRLGFPRGSSVFPAPCRAAAAAADYSSACLLNARACGRKLSRQTYNILPKILAVDRLITPALQSNIRECHPELVFAVLAGNGRGLANAKKTPAGEAERLARLGRVLPRLDLTAIRASLGTAGVTRDDIVDAAACLVTALRIAAGVAIVLPESDIPTDDRALRMEIVA